ncbi:MAG: tetratricopeptide repeat protein, partial [Pseudomonadota bacterium]
VLDSNTNASRDDIDYRVTAVAKDLNDNNRFTIELINNHTSQLVWARNYDVADDISVTDKVVRELFTHIFGDSKEALEGRDPETLTAQQLTLMATWVSGPATNALNWETERAELARLAISKDPNYGPAYSVLADKLSYLGSVDGPSDTQAASQEAAASRQKALELSPRDPNAMFNEAQSYWHSGNVLEAVRAMERVLEIDPNRALARFFAGAIPYTCKPAPDEALQTAIDFDASLSPDNPVRWVTLTWIGWLHFNRDEYELALEAEKRSAQIFQIPYTVMRHAAILSKLGRNDEAAELLRSQKSNWPNISPDHFANKTIPKLCRDFPGETKMVGFYKSLAEAMKGRL